MNSRLSHLVWCALVWCGVIAVAGCSAESKHRWLVSFFDGVEPAPSTPAPAADVPDRKEVSSNQVTAAPQVPPAPVIFYHQPYTERKCSECHAGLFSQKLRMPATKLCFECHRNRIFTGKFIHSPVESGDCLSCHHPHSASEPHLLIRKGQALCLECHDKEEMAKVKGHERIGTDACQSCHNPHSADEKSLLKTK